MRLYSQSAYVLTIQPPKLSELERLLGDYEIVARPQPAEDVHWSITGPALMIKRPDEPEHGRVLIDVLPERYPDHMGDPQRDPTLFAAWEAGCFGPYVFPKAIARAGQQAWLWKGASNSVRMHAGCIRMRSCTVAEDGTEAPPPPVRTEELMAITKLANQLSRANGSVAYFNPNGEAIRPPGFVNKAVQEFASDGLLPIDCWTNVRVVAFEGEDVSTAWAVMDTVGMQQIDLPDVEAWFRRGRFEFADIDQFLRGVQDYMVDAGDVLKDKDTILGPGDVDWRIDRVEHTGSLPPRPVVRLTATDEANVPDLFEAPLPPGPPPGFGDEQ